MNCRVCARQCALKSGQVGFCGGYANVARKLKNIVYDNVMVIREPLARLPLVSWAERREALAFASPGCNSRCVHCINRGLSYGVEKVESPWTPEEIVGTAAHLGCALATDFVEPVNIFQFVLHAFELASEQGVPKILSTAGTFTEPALKSLLRFTDVVRLDIKGWTDRVLGMQGFGFSVDQVLMTAMCALQFGVHLELTICVIPGVNDGEGELGAVASWLIGNLGRDTPVTLIGHRKVSTTVPWPDATDSDLRVAAGVLVGAGLQRIEIVNLEEYK